MPDYAKYFSEMDIQVERNLKGIELEKLGKVDDAIVLYEQNITENFDGSHPYYRLSEIYHKGKLYNEEIRILEKAIYVFENIVYKDRSDRLNKLNKFKTRLASLRNSQ
jgi:tetratricopeptide (TPR) repeat protein